MIHFGYYLRWTIQKENYDRVYDAMYNHDSQSYSEALHRCEQYLANELRAHQYIPCQQGVTVSIDHDCGDIESMIITVMCMCNKM